MIDDKFQSTLSVRRATTTLAVDAAPVQFQSTLSVRRATYVTRGHIGIANISIHALRKESDRTGEYQRHDQPISIHALRKESDPTLSGRGLFHVISIHALRKESDCLSTAVFAGLTKFQSTLSVRRATVQLDIFVHFLRRKPAAWL